MSSTSPNAQTRRLLQDLESYHKSPLPFIRDLKYSVDKEGFNQLHGVLIGPEKTPYENGYFHFRIKFPLEYPFKIHEFYFLTPICHPNIRTDNGATCHDEFITSWSPKITIHQIFSKMHALLANPDYEKFYNEEKVSGKDPETARKWTEKYAQSM